MAVGFLYERMAGYQIFKNTGYKLVRFAHNWNNGILELWNDGFIEKVPQCTYSAMDFIF
jgi:hypothetical protein